MIARARALLRQFRFGLSAALVLVAMSLALFTSETKLSPTEDEFFHTTRGLAFWWTKDARLSYFHPPLANAWTTLPFAAKKPARDITRLRGWNNGDVFGVTRDYIAVDYPSLRAHMRVARGMMILTATLFGIYLYRWARALFGSKVALVGLLIFASHPIILAHAQLNTTDFPVAALTLVTVGEVVRYLRTTSLARLATASVSFAAVCITKFSALAVGPIILVIAAIVAWRARPGLKRILTCAVVILVAFAATTVLAVNVAYRFQDTGLSVTQILERPDPGQRGAGKGSKIARELKLASLPPSLRIPLPYTYIAALAEVGSHNTRGHSSYFWGETGNSGWKLYFPTLLSIKSPVTPLLLLGLFVVQLRRRSAVAAKRTPVAVWAMVVIVATFLGAGVFAHLNIGVRHMLPAAMATVIIAAHAWGKLARSPKPSHKKIAGAALAALVIEGALAYPRYLDHFNVLVGPERGRAISIVGEDWGQSLGELASAVKRDKLTPLYFVEPGLFRKEELKFHGVDVSIIKCGKTPEGRGWVATHRSHYMRRKRTCYPYDRGAPDLQIDRNIYLFHLQEPSTGVPLADP